MIGAIAFVTVLAIIAVYAGVRWIDDTAVTEPANASIIHPDQVGALRNRSGLQ